MWEDLKVYKQLDKADINPTFKKFGNTLISLLDGYSIDQTASLIKLFRQVNQLEQAVFIEKDKGSYNLKVKTSIKPVDFYRGHKFTMLNIVPLGDIMNNHRRTSYPLTQEWNDLALYLATRIKTEIEHYFQKYNSYDKIIDRRKEIEPKDFGLDNKYELLIYAAIKTKKKELLNQYLDKKMSRPVMGITQSEYLKPDNQEIDEKSFLDRLKSFALTGDFINIEKEIAAVGGQN
ncbi:MAG: hypothetical protein KBF82_13315 [Chitinophagaceae bacterium]|nr:hypothetical protein [Chitinophagaceae bacterium]MBP9104843.1 hypothetical protein [Chitinophagaceae bacterium]